MRGTWFLGGGRHATGQRVGVDPALAALLGPRAGVHVAPEVCGIHHRQTVQGRVLIICLHGSRFSVQQGAKLCKMQKSASSYSHMSLKTTKHCYCFFCCCCKQECGWRWGSVCRAWWGGFDNRNLLDGHALESRNTLMSFNVARSC